MADARAHLRCIGVAWSLGMLGPPFALATLVDATAFLVVSQLGPGLQVDALTQMPRVDEALQQQQRFLRNLSVPAPVA